MVTDFAGAFVLAESLETTGDSIARGWSAGRPALTWPRARGSLRCVGEPESNPAAMESERWLLEAGLAHSRPGTVEYDPEVASDHFVALLERHPDTRHRILASYLLPLLAEEARQRQRVERLTGDGERLRQQLAETHARIQGLNQLLDSLEERDGTYRQTIERLQATVQTRTRQLREMEEKLNALMRVDLESRP